jgi:hypothetical protein
MGGEGASIEYLLRYLRMFLFRSKIIFMSITPRSRPILRIVENRKPSVLDDRRVVVDFTRVCEVVGIIDSATGLIRSPQRDRE